MTGRRGQRRRIGRRPAGSPPPQPTAGPLAPSVTIVRAPGRRELRRQRQRRSRRIRGLIAAAVVVLLALVGGALGVGLGVHQGTPPAAAGARPQATLLFQLRGADGSAVVSALLAHDTRTGQGAEILIPSRVISEVPGSGSLLFGRALALPNGANLSRDALADLMNVTVDGSWVVTTGGLAALIDRVGGVTVTVDTTITTPVRGGGQAVLLNPGRQLLSGANAVTYAGYLAPGEPQIADLPRLQAVLDALMARLPAQPGALAGELTALGGGSAISGLSMAQTAALLVEFARDDAGNRVQYDTLPTTTLEVGSGPASYGIDTGQVQQLVSTVLADSVPPGAVSGSRRVLVENGVGTPGLGSSVRDRLVNAGLQVVGDRNAPHFGFRTSLVLIFAETSQQIALGDEVARALNLDPAKVVRVSTRDQNIADVIVIIGADYRG
ncbi:MAG TPA: LytR C-terminal domain-containing protein [Mycobacteriales bacterium]|nr:LytR C-terminal domain-containing protein [Mycobacteriales bacterium]